MFFGHEKHIFRPRKTYYCLACVASVSARVGRESWEERARKEECPRKGRAEKKTSPSLSSSISFALAPTLAQYLDVKRLLRRLTITAWRDWHIDFPRFQDPSTCESQVS